METPAGQNLTSNETEFVNGRQLAKILGITPIAVWKAVKAGRIPVDYSRGNLKLFNPEKAKAAYLANTAPQLKRDPGVAAGVLSQSEADTMDEDEVPLPDAEKYRTPSAADVYSKPSTVNDDPDPVGDYSANRARRESVMLQIAELELKKKQGALVPREAVERAAAEAASVTKTAILNVPNRIADQLAGMTDPHAILNLLNSELNQALQEMIDEQQRRLGLLGTVASMSEA